MSKLSRRELNLEREPKQAAMSGGISPRRVAWPNKLGACPRCGFTPYGPHRCGEEPLARFRNERRRQGWSIDRLAVASGVGIRTIKELEHRVKRASLPTRRKLLKVLGIAFGEHEAWFGPVWDRRKVRE